MAYKILLGVLSIFLFAESGFSQANTVATGYDITDSEGSLSVSVGQIDYLNIATQAGFAAEGVQQTYEWLTTYYSGPIIDDDGLTLFPNPTLNWITVSTDNISSFAVRLFTSVGQQLMVKTFEETNSFTIDCSQYPSGSYLIQIKNLRTTSAASVYRIIRL